MRMDLLRLNESKTKFMMLGTKRNLDKTDACTASIKIGDDEINNVMSVRDLGFHLDYALKPGMLVNKLTSALFITLKRIASIQHLLHDKPTKIMMQALVLSKLDYCNSLFIGTTHYNLDKLQKIQNMTFRIIFKLRKYDHISDHLSQLHWLKVRQHIIYQTLLLVFECICNLAPPYLYDLMTTHLTIILRSTDQNKLPTMKFNTALVKKSSFKSMGPHLCNDLPTEIRCIDKLETFKTSLKTLLFCMCYCRKAN